MWVLWFFSHHNPFGLNLTYPRCFDLRFLSLQESNVLSSKTLRFLGYVSMGIYPPIFSWRYFHGLNWYWIQFWLEHWSRFRKEKRIVIGGYWDWIRGKGPCPWNALRASLGVTTDCISYVNSCASLRPWKSCFLNVMNFNAMFYDLWVPFLKFIHNWLSHEMWIV